jgi:hypothetical protein
MAAGFLRTCWARWKRVVVCEFVSGGGVAVVGVVAAAVQERLLRRVFRQGARSEVNVSDTIWTHSLIAIYFGRHNTLNSCYVEVKNRYNLD